MRERRARTDVAAALLFTVSVLLALAGGVLAVAGGADLPALLVRFDLSQVALALSFGGVGAFLASRRPAVLVGWLLLAIASGAAVLLCLAEYAGLAAFAAPGLLPAGEVAIWLTQWLWFPWLLLPAVFLPLTFPDGRLPGSGWRWVVVVAAGAALALSLSGMLEPRSSDVTLPGVINPYAPRGLPPALLGLLTVVGVVLLGAAVLGAAASLVVRYRRGGWEERQQLKWLLYSLALLAAALTLPVVVYLFDPRLASLLGGLLQLLAAPLVAVAVAFAVTRRRLYDIDLVINRTLLFAALAVFITGVYVAIVVGVGELLTRSASPSFGLSLLATALVAIAFQPVRERLQRLANRLVYGRVAAPEQVLEEFGGRVAAVYAGGELLQRTARVLGEGTGAARAAVFMRRGEELEPVAAWPPEGSAPGWLSLREGRLPPTPGLAEVRHQGQLLGALAVTRADRSLTPVEERLLQDLAAQAGAVLHNVGLTGQLEERLEELSRQEVELRRSRERIVAAQDAERRRLERNIHDGAQQHLVALAVKIRLARTLSERDPEKACELLQQLRREVDLAQETVHDLAGGIYPRLLQDRGLGEALRRAGRTLGLELRLEERGLGRQPEELEAAVYFCCLEAMQNAAKHAPGAPVEVELEAAEGRLRFQVGDRGPGFDPARAGRGAGLTNMADRVAALGGWLEVDSAPGRGTRVAGAVPLRVDRAA